MKHIGIDCRFAGIQCGLGRYTTELVYHLLLRNDDIQYTLFVRNSEEKWIQKLPKKAQIIVADIPHYSFAEQLKFPGIIKASGVDLFFSPHFNIPLRCPVPFIVTIHDLILHKFPNQASFLKQAAYRVLMKHAVKDSEKIITVSNHVAKELSDVYGKDINAKTYTIYEGVCRNFVPASEEKQKEVMVKHGIRKPFLLYVGNAKQHKHVQMLLDAYKKADSDYSLVLVSGGKELSSLHMPSGVQVLSGISDSDLSVLYCAATAFVTASHYEGFGLPIAESQACGTPVIAIHCSAIPEVADESAALTQSTISALADAMVDADSMDSPSENRFLWDDTAQHVYSNLC